MTTDVQPPGGTFAAVSAFFCDAAVADEGGGCAEMDGVDVGAVADEVDPPEANIESNCCCL